ncbi:MAG TPA: ammonia-forming cytochrome c nitrite reductase subunit c552 [Gemmatimonadales bacterium]|nr:ammonia-forming cytochrome c nitrite reductase subunit c552 [Gemmatimonadales bacterium]
MRDRERGAGSRDMGKTGPYVLIGIVAAGAAVGTAALLVNIFERKAEARSAWVRVVELTDTTEAPDVWGQNFPFQYDGYTRTVDQVRTRFGGSEAHPRSPTSADPRSVVAQSRLEEDPRLRTFWAGYAFARDFREERGHAYMLVDQLFTERQRVTTQPGTCLHCHASVYVPYLRAGEGDLFRGWEILNAMPYDSARRWVTHPLTCIDCHDPRTMQLRVTRPAFIEGIRALRAAQGVRNYDVNRQATRQEMRSFVCGQCHVEYYFQGPQRRLVYPWLRGLTVDSMLAYYDSVGFRDWVHAQSGAPVLKAQHPEFEMWSMGIHARSGVACADCHMPYTRVGAQKVSDHHVRSPLLNISRACQTCHRFPEEELRARAEAIQERTWRLRNQALDAVLALIGDLQRARQARGASQPAITTAMALHRRAQFMVDFVEAENSMGFHAPAEAARILADAMNLARQGQIVLRDPTWRPQELPASAVSAVGSILRR